MSGWREESIPGPGEAFPVPDGVFPRPEYLLNQGVPAYPPSARAMSSSSAARPAASGRWRPRSPRHVGAAYVIGTAGGPEKCRYLVDELGLDAAIDHHNDDLDDRLTKLAPDQIQAWSTHYAQCYAEGRIRFAHTLLEGTLQRAITAQDELLAGVHRGNVIVRLARWASLSRQDTSEKVAVLYQVC
jgi:hypothetical protein